METIWTVHYTNNKDWRLHQVRIRNRDHLKPDGGIWACPVDASFGWREWCKEKGHTDQWGKPFPIYLEVCMERAIVVERREDLEKLVWVPMFGDASYLSWLKRPDWVEMKRLGVDVVYVTEKGEQATRFGRFSERGTLPGQDLYGWDCDSILILRERAVLQVRKTRPKGGKHDH